MTKSAVVPEQATRRVTRSSTKEAATSKASGRKALCDISNKRLTRSSQGKSTDVKSVPAERRSRKDVETQQQKVDAKKSSEKSTDFSENHSSSRKRKHQETQDNVSSNKKPQSFGAASVKSGEGLPKNRGRNQRKSGDTVQGKEGDKTETKRNRGRSSQSKATISKEDVVNPQSKHSKRQQQSVTSIEEADAIPAVTSRRRSASRSSSARPRLRSSSRNRNATPTQRRRRNNITTLCSDFLEGTDYGLVQLPFDSSKYTFGIAAHDTPQRNDVLEVADYVTDIFQRLYHAEELTRPKCYVHLQPQLNAMMRTILVDWIVEVHMKFHLAPATLYLCVNIIDRFLNVTGVDKTDLQLVGVSALLLACKYEEIYPPEVRDCVYITDRAYTRQNVLDMEQEIVKRLDFRMSVPTGHPFLQRFLTITQASSLVGIAANYYMERVLQEHEMLEYRPSLVAAAAVCLALNNPDVRMGDNEHGPKPGMPHILLNHTGFSKDDIVLVARKIASHVSKHKVVCQSGRKLIAVRRKYESDKYKRISVDFSDPHADDLNIVDDDI